AADGDRHHQCMEPDRSGHETGSAVPAGRRGTRHRPGAAVPLSPLRDRAELERVRARLLGIGYRVTGTWADAEEAADEALARLVALGSGEAPDNPEAWLTTVTTRLCLDRLRRRRREASTG